MKCPHCHKEYDDSYSFCPFCAEPKPEQTEEPTVQDKVNEVDATIWQRGILMFLISILPTIVIGYIIAFLIYLFSPVEDMYNQTAIFEKFINIMDGKRIILLSTLVSLVISLLAVWSWKSSDAREKMISVQFAHDDTSICPRCGSHDIALGRKGYDWNYAWWGGLLKSRTMRYTAGMDSRRVTAHCKHCGHNWLTDREWLK